MGRKEIKGRTLKMESKGIFGRTISMLEKVLDLRAMRHNLIVSNIANIDTPQYKAFDLVVEEELKRAMGSGKNLGLKKSQPAHIPAGEARRDNITYRPIPARFPHLNGP
jgi:flagellar basal-body rod protein FlgB